jgi:3-dehydroquinate dehydratase-2
MGYKVKVLHGPNLNLLGHREPDVYGTTTLDAIDTSLTAAGVPHDCVVDASQHNSEGGLVDAIQSASKEGYDGILINPAAYTHTSVAIRDALLAVGIPVVEVHLSNTHAREAFRHHSTIADIVLARVMGFGARGYVLALEGLIDHLEHQGVSPADTD